MIYPGKFGGIPSTGSRDIEGTRFCHADTDTDAESFWLQRDPHWNQNVPPHLWWGDIIYAVLIPLNAPQALHLGKGGGGHNLDPDGK